MDNDCASCRLLLGREPVNGICIAIGHESIFGVNAQIVNTQMVGTAENLVSMHFPNQS